MNRAPPLLLLVVLPALAACGTDVTGPATTLLSCIYGESAQLGPGEVHQVRGAANESVCLDLAGDADASFLYIPFFGTPAPGDGAPEVTLGIDISAGGLSSALAESVRGRGGVTLLDGPGAGLRAPRWRPDPTFHDWLRRREIEELGPRIRAGGARGGAADAAVTARAPAAADVPAIGEMLELNTAISCSGTSLRTGQVMNISDHAIVVADVENPAGLTADDYAYFAVTFDTLVHPVLTGHFGESTDIDENERAILFFTTAVNALSEPDEETITLGFFWSGDLFPAEDTPRLQACPGGNDAEMFYLIAPDPDGVAGPAISLESVRELAIPLIGHEYQHLINASRRLYVNEARRFEEGWLNEGLSHIAEELLFYEAADLGVGANLNAEDIRAAPNGREAFNEYMSGNLTNFQRYLQRPDTASLMGIDLLATRGASWAFLRYAADRSGRPDEAFFGDLVNSTEAGLDNLDAVLPDPGPLDWMRDWTVSVYADDLVPELPERFQLQSWNLRSVFEGSTVEEYPLELRTPDSSGRLSLSLLAGGAAYVLFDVAGDERAVIRVESDDEPPPSALRGSVVRVR